ncbi:MAG: hypothetical protein RJB04_1172, partial [Verrucomicrobiota bacterium]
MAAATPLPRMTVPDQNGPRIGPVAGACATRLEGRSGNAAATRLQNADDFMDEE